MILCQVQFLLHFSNIFCILSTARMFFQLQYTLHPRLILRYQLCLIKFWVFCLHLQFVLLHFRILWTFLALQKIVCCDTVFGILENRKSVLLRIHLSVSFLGLLLHKLTICINGCMFLDHPDFLNHFQVAIEWWIGFFRHVLKTIFEDVG